MAVEHGWSVVDVLAALRQPPLSCRAWASVRRSDGGHTCVFDANKSDFQTISQSIFFLSIHPSIHPSIHFSLSLPFSLHLYISSLLPQFLQWREQCPIKIQNRAARPKKRDMHKQLVSGGNPTAEFTSWPALLREVWLNVPPLRIVKAQGRLLLSTSQHLAAPPLALQPALPARAGRTPPSQNVSEWSRVLLPQPCPPPSRRASRACLPRCSRHPTASGRCFVNMPRPRGTK